MSEQSKEAKVRTPSPEAWIAAMKRWPDTAQTAILDQAVREILAEQYDAGAAAERERIVAEIKKIRDSEILAAEDACDELLRRVEGA